MQNNINQFDGIKIYGISFSTPEEHTLLKETYNLDFELLTDDGQFGFTFGFIDEEQKVYRGYVGVNPETKAITGEVDYLIGENIKTVIQKMQEL